MRDISKTPLAESLPLELRLLIICARTQLDDASSVQLRALVGAGVDWEEVLKGAHHGVMPLLHRHLSGLGAPGVPASVLEQLGSYARKNAVHNLMLVHAEKFARLAAHPREADRSPCWYCQNHFKKVDWLQNFLDHPWVPHLWGEGETMKTA